MGLSHRHPPARARREMFQVERGTGMRLAMYAGSPVQKHRGGAGKHRDSRAVYARRAEGAIGMKRLEEIRLWQPKKLRSPSHV